MSKLDVIIGIDPDVSRSGVCQLGTKAKNIKLFNYSFTELCDYFNKVKDEKEKLKLNIVVVIEASWCNSHNTHLKSGQSKAAASKTGYNVGRNHQTGMCICDLAKYYGLEVIERTPLRKHWKGNNGKITHDELSYFTGITERSNQETRDATLIAWDYAGFLIRTKT